MTLSASLLIDFSINDGFVFLHGQFFLGGGGGITFLMHLHFFFFDKISKRSNELFSLQPHPEAEDPEAEDELELDEDELEPDEEELDDEFFP